MVNPGGIAKRVATKDFISAVERELKKEKMTHKPSEFEKSTGDCRARRRVGRKADVMSDNRYRGKVCFLLSPPPSPFIISGHLPL